MKHLFVKSPSTERFIYNFLSQTGAYVKEIEFYADIMPRLQQILLEIDQDIDIFVNPFHIDHEKRILFLEDESVNGYQISALRPGLSLDETKLILLNLAQFHAASAVLQHRRPNIFKNFKHGKYTFYTAFSDKIGLRKMASTQIKICQKSVATHSVKCRPLQ